MTIVKVGGSLLDWPELGPRLRAWLAARSDPVALVPGGGPTTDLVRALDRQHDLGEERAHWLALRALAFNAHFLSVLVPMATVVATISELEAVRMAGGIAILDAYAFLLADEGRPGALEHTWAAGSDIVALRLAALIGARRLVLLKSTALTDGLVDAGFSAHARASPGVVVEIVDFRSL